MAALWYAAIARFTACQSTHTYTHIHSCGCGFSTVPAFACNTLDIHHSSFASCHTSCSYFAAYKFRFSLSLLACICIYSCCCSCWGATEVCLSFEIQIFRQLLVPTTATLIVSGIRRKWPWAEHECSIDLARVQWCVCTENCHRN